MTNCVLLQEAFEAHDVICGDGDEARAERDNVIAGPHTGVDAAAEPIAFRHSMRDAHGPGVHTKEDSPFRHSMHEARSIDSGDLIEVHTTHSPVAVA